LKITVITASKNNSSTLQDCLDSVFQQTYNDIEHILVDSSEDKISLDIIDKNKHKIDKIIFQKPSGIYHALNTGLKNAHGDIIGILHADDQFYNKNILSNVAFNFKNKKILALYGNIKLVGKNYSRIWISGNYNVNNFKKGWHPPHTSIFISKKLYLKHGFFNTKYTIASDYELILRFFYSKKENIFYLNKFIVTMLIGGKSTKSIKNIILSNFEVYKILKENKIKFKILVIVRKILYKINQIKFF